RRPPRSTLFPYTSSSDLRWRVRRGTGRQPALAQRQAARRGQGGSVSDAATTTLTAPALRPGFRLAIPLFVTLLLAVALLGVVNRSEEHTSELQSRANLVC